MSRVTQNPTEPPPVSSMIDNIEMVREIGRGGFGRVFLVKDEAGMYYALKKNSARQKRTLRERAFRIKTIPKNKG